MAWGDRAYLHQDKWLLLSVDMPLEAYIGVYTSMYPSIILKQVVMLCPRVEKSVMAELQRKKPVRANAMNMMKNTTRNQRLEWKLARRVRVS